MNIHLPKLLFQNPNFHSGVNLSVRRGVKWSLEKLAIVADLQGNKIAEVELETRVVRFCDLKDSDVSGEHDPECRTYAGLLKAMKDIYPGFDEREIVTLVYFLQ